MPKKSPKSKPKKKVLKKKNKTFHKKYNPNDLTKINPKEPIILEKEIIENIINEINNGITTTNELHEKFPNISRRQIKHIRWMCKYGNDNEKQKLINESCALGRVRLIKKRKVKVVNFIINLINDKYNFNKCKYSHGQYKLLRMERNRGYHNLVCLMSAHYIDKFAKELGLN
jgi:hypothetical protein